ncbi:MAG: Cyclin-dependent kinases regulatory subunit (Cell division control protein cks1) [Chrysothrix sp. TS-e1954]|nr:MAG: Cyclin-dependent kinases regulatory subunit (Cell division control protein cks1) [Chrysothrix sp. TS-e1954]
MSTTNDIDMTRRNKRPRMISPNERTKLEEYVEQIHYSSRYSDDDFEYRHVQLPKSMLKVIPRDYMDGSRGTMKLLWEEEWRGLGITQVRTIHGSRRCGNRERFADHGRVRAELGLGALRGA